MIVINNTRGRIEDYTESNGIVTLYGNKKADLSLLKDSKTLEVTTEGRTKTAKVVKLVPREKDFLYIRNRAVSAGNVIEHSSGSAELVPIDEYYNNFAKYAPICRNANQNGDFFSHEELVNTYKTFIGKSVFVDHKDENVMDARGIILDAIYNTNGYFVELLEAIDKKAFPQLAAGIEKHYITDTSMGCHCAYAICSICGNKAYTNQDICEHVLNYKGLTYNGLPVFEDNRGVEFFEDSIVSEGADPDAKILERVASKQNRSNIFIPKYYHKSENTIRDEKNQRTYEGKVKSLSEQLSELWK
jgi:hypothetical protein